MNYPSHVCSRSSHLLPLAVVAICPVNSNRTVRAEYRDGRMEYSVPRVTILSTTGMYALHPSIDDCISVG